MTDIEGQTPLHYAVNCDQSPVIEFYYKIDSENFIEGLTISNGSEISYKPETEIEFPDKNILYRAIKKSRWIALASILKLTQIEDLKAEDLAKSCGSLEIYNSIKQNSDFTQNQA